MNEQQLVIISLGDARYAIDVQQIREIVKPKSITPIPHTPSFVEGLMNLRGQIVTVINLAERLAALNKEIFAANEDKRLPQERIVVINHGGELIGLRVQTVEHVMSVKSSSIELPAQNNEEADIVSGVIQINNALVMLLNTSLLLQPFSGGGEAHE